MCAPAFRLYPGQEKSALIFIISYLIVVFCGKKIIKSFDIFMEKMLDAGFWMLVFKKGNCPYLIPAKDGIFDQHQASSIQYQLVKWHI